MLEKGIDDGEVVELAAVLEVLCVDCGNASLQGCGDDERVVKAVSGLGMNGQGLLPDAGRRVGLAMGGEEEFQEGFDDLGGNGLVPIVQGDGAEFLNDLPTDEPRLIFADQVLGDLLLLLVLSGEGIDKNIGIQEVGRGIAHRSFISSRV